MAIAYRAGGSAPARTTSGTQTLTVSPSTNAGNFVIVVVGNSNTAASSWATSSASGLGATWSGPYLLPNVTGSTTTNGAVFFGYNCSGGNTSITLSNLPATSSAITSWGLFSGVKTNASPLSSTWATTLGSTGTVVTTGSVSYNSGDLVLGLAWCFTWLATPAPSFSTAGTATNIWTGNTGVGARSSWSSYAVASSSGSTTYTTEGVQATSQAVAGQMVFTAAPVVTLTGSGSASVVAGTANLTVTAGAVNVTGSGSASVSGTGNTGTTVFLNGFGPLGSGATTVASSTVSFTSPTSYPSSTTIAGGINLRNKNIYAGLSIEIDDVSGIAPLQGIVTSYTASTGSITLTAYAGPNGGNFSNWSLLAYYGVSGSGTVSAFYPITGSGSGSVTGSGTLTSFVPITGTGSVSVTGSGSLTVIPPVDVAGTGTASVSATGTLYPFEPVAGSGSFGTVGMGDVSAYLPVSGSGITSVSGSGVLTSFVPVSGQGNATVTGTASISAFLPLSGQGVISTLGNGQIVVYVHSGAGKVRGGILAPNVQGNTSTVGSVRGAIRSPKLEGAVKAPSIRGKILSPRITGDTEIKQ